MHKPYIHLATIIVAVCLVYSNTLDVPFHFDDISNIVKNPVIRDASLLADPAALDHIALPESLNAPLLKTRAIGYGSFAVNYTLHELDVRGYHLVNIAIHMVNALLVYWLIILTFGTPYFAAQREQSGGITGSRDFIALFTALLLAVHPIQTQAVTYIVQRFASLATLFYLLALALYIRCRLLDDRDAHAGTAKRPANTVLKYSLYAASLACFVLAIKTKEFSLTLPLLLILYEFMFLKGSRTTRILHIAPYALVALLVPLSLTNSEGVLPGISSLDRAAADISGAQDTISRTSYLFTQFRVMATYLRLLILPVNQNLDYDYPVYDTFFAYEVVLSVLLLLSLLITGAWLKRLSSAAKSGARFRLRLAAFGIFWFFVTSSAESGIIPIADVIFEHRMYLPSFGFFLAATSLIDFTGSLSQAKRVSIRKALFSSMIALVVLLSAATYERNKIWQDSLRLWEDTVAKSPSKARPHNNLGEALIVADRVPEAIREFEQAVALDPDYEDALHNLATAYGNAGRREEAIALLEKELTLDPYDAEDRMNLAMNFDMSGRTEEALQQYQFIIQNMPTTSQAAFARQMIIMLGSQSSGKSRRKP